MKTADIVIGLNYGDEGKGSIVDAIDNSWKESPKDKTTAVVRFNGGAQAGHTVSRFRKYSQVFHQLGSGTLNGTPTILSRFHLLCPYMFRIEAAASKMHSEVYIDPRAIVVTPFDIFLNQELEKFRGNSKHGSCGGGIGESVQRTEAGESLVVADLLLEEDDLKEKLLNIFEGYVTYRAMYELDIFDENPKPWILFRDNITSIINNFIQDCKWTMGLATVEKDVVIFNRYEHLIFEGAQGLLLDQNSSDFPHVTRSNTGLKNIEVLLKGFKVNTTVHYVTRCYLTRHGAGPLKGEYMGRKLIEDSTNTENRYQGHLRIAPLDFDRMGKEVKIDLSHLRARPINVMVHMTWCDQYCCNIDELYTVSHLSMRKSTLKELAKKVLDSIPTASLALLHRSPQKECRAFISYLTRLPSFARLSVAQYREGRNYTRELIKLGRAS